MMKYIRVLAYQMTIYVFLVITIALAVALLSCNCSDNSEETLYDSLDDRQITNNSTELELMDPVKQAFLDSTIELWTPIRVICDGMNTVNYYTAHSLPISHPDKLTNGTLPNVRDSWICLRSNEDAVIWEISKQSGEQFASLNGQVFSYPESIDVSIPRSIPCYEYDITNREHNLLCDIGSFIDQIFPKPVAGFLISVDLPNDSRSIGAISICSTIPNDTDLVDIILLVKYKDNGELELIDEIHYRMNGTGTACYIVDDKVILIEYIGFTCGADICKVFNLKVGDRYSSLEGIPLTTFRFISEIEGEDVSLEFAGLYNHSIHCVSLRERIGITYDIDSGITDEYILAETRVNESENSWRFFSP